MAAKRGIFGLRASAGIAVTSGDDMTYVYDDVTYVYDDVTYVYDDVTYVLIDTHLGPPPSPSLYTGLFCCV